MKKHTLLGLLTLLFIPLISSESGTNKENIIVRKSKETVTPIEMNHGEKIRYYRGDGLFIELELVSTAANIFYTNKDKIPHDESNNDRGNMFRARLLYEFTCEVKINGLPMTMRRYVGSQESYYEPYVVDGVRIWFDGVSAINEENGGFLNTAREANGLPKKHARFAFQDMEKRICPGEIHAWFKDDGKRNENFIYKENFIDIGRSYNGDDCFMGAYLGGEAHGAMDIDMPQNSLLYMPFDVDTQQGIRANASKTWPDGSEWRINTGHIIEKFVADDVPVKAGTAYARGAFRGTGMHTHSHFAFQIMEEDILYDIDTWMVFWQHFEDNKKRDGALKAMMEPLKHSRTGDKVKFQSICNLSDEACSKINHYWTFGDGGSSDGFSAEHIYTKPGIYPVTLTIDNGLELATFTQHITIEGQKMEKPALVLSCPEEPAFRIRPQEVMDVYGWPVKFVPNTLDFLARASRPKPNTKKLLVKNHGLGNLSPVTYSIEYKNSEFSWVEIQPDSNQAIQIGVNGTGLPSGNYQAIVSVYSEGALNSPQKFRVTMEIPDYPAESEGVIIDDKDEAFYCTPYFWIGHRYHGWGWPELKDAEGYNHFYLFNGERAKKGEFARFQPDLEQGTYELWLYEKTPYASGPPANNEPARFQVRVVSAKGDTTLWMEPERINGFYPRPHQSPKGWNWYEPQPSRKIGTFKFEEGNDGFVEILSEGSSGQVIVDAVRFLKMIETEK